MARKDRANRSKAASFRSNVVLRIATADSNRKIDSEWPTIEIAGGHRLSKDDVSTLGEAATSCTTQVHVF